MLPHNHFIIAGAVTAPAALMLSPDKSVSQVVAWVVVAGLVSAAIDLDVEAMVLLKSRGEPRLQPFRDPLEVYRNFSGFMDTIEATGVLRAAMVTHFLMAALAVLVFYLFSDAYIVPAALGVVSHIISDVPNMRRAMG